MTHKDLENAEKLLKKHGQSHLLAFWERLNAPQRQNLLAQIQQLDFTRIDDWVAKYVKKPRFTTIPADFEPASYYGESMPIAERLESYLAGNDKALEFVTVTPDDLERFGE